METWSDSRLHRLHRADLNRQVILWFSSRGHEGNLGCHISLGFRLLSPQIDSKGTEMGNGTSQRPVAKVSKCSCFILIVWSRR